MTEKEELLGLLDDFAYAIADVGDPADATEWERWDAQHDVVATAPTKKTKKVKVAAGDHDWVDAGDGGSPVCAACGQFNDGRPRSQTCPKNKKA